MPRLAPLVVSLLALLVAGCEEELPADPTRFHSDLEVLVTVDGEPVEEMQVILTSYDAKNGVVERSLAETSSSGIARFDKALPDPRPGMVIAPYISAWPIALPCTDVPREIAVQPRPCGMVALHYSSRPDAPPVRITESMMPVVAQVLPCDLRPAPTTGGFSECATWGSTRTEAGPGIKVISASILVAEDCGRSWVSKTRRTGRTISWPEPFDGYARVEVEIAC